MNKLFMKVATLSVGLAMAIGVGVAVGSKQSSPRGVEAVTGTFTKYTSAIAEGDYVIVGIGSSRTSAMTTGTNNTRIKGTSVTIVSSTTITNPSDSIVYHIAPSGNYWTITMTINNVVNYVSSTGAANKAQYLASPVSESDTDKTLWTVTLNDGVFNFVNKKKCRQ